MAVIVAATFSTSQRKKVLKYTMWNLRPQNPVISFVNMIATILMLGFAVSALQFLVGERQYSRLRLLFPSFVNALGLGLIFGGNGWELATVIFTLTFIARYFVSSVRVALMIFFDIKPHEAHYNLSFLIAVLAEQTAIFWIIKQL